jgi:hypothetical protein
LRTNYDKWRIQVGPTKLLGPQYRRSRDLIVLTLTYDCNLRCLNCNQSATQAPSTEAMSLEQIESFLAESRDKNQEWKRIRLSGGEPTKHPRFLEIIDLLLDYKQRHAPATVIDINTNGSGRQVREKLAQLPPQVLVNDTSKESLDTPQTPYYFRTFNVAPIDVPEYSDKVDYTNACETPQFCGIGLSKNGYYPCVIAAGIDRIFGWGLGRKELPDRDDGMYEEFRCFCSVCGQFKREAQAPPNDSVISPTWERAYKTWEANQLPIRDSRDIPALTRIVTAEDAPPHNRVTWLASPGHGTPADC